MIFYNGFNLMIDLIIMGVAVYAVRRARVEGWIEGYGQGEADLQEHWENEMIDMGVIER
jgi:hypothetical protein